MNFVLLQVGESVTRKQKKCHVNFQKKISDRKSFFTFIHQEYIRNLLDEDPQLYTENIVKIFYWTLSFSKGKLLIVIKLLYTIAHSNIEQNKGEDGEKLEATSTA